MIMAAGNDIIGFIGGGNMAEALFAGLLRAGRDPAGVLVAEPDGARRERMGARHGVAVTADNREVAARCDPCVVAVKPQVMAAVLRPLADLLSSRRPLIVSVAAGVTLDDPTVGDVERAVASAKLMANEAALGNVKSCVQVHGGMGYTWEVDAHLFFKRAHVLEACFGSREECADRMAELVGGGRDAA